jgi:hypothetical protein
VARFCQEFGTCFENADLANWQMPLSTYLLTYVCMYVCT